MRVGLPPSPPWRGVARAPPLLVRRVSGGVTRARLRAACHRAHGRRAGCVWRGRGCAPLAGWCVTDEAGRDAGAVARRWCVMGDKFRGLGVAWARSCAAHPVGEWWGTECMLVCGFWGVLLGYVRLL